MIETKRLLIRNLNEKDLDDLGLILKDDETMYAYEGAFLMMKFFHGWKNNSGDIGIMVLDCGLLFLRILAR